MTLAAAAFASAPLGDFFAEGSLAAYDPDDVRPGWIALVLVITLAIATYVLWRSMNTQLRKIQMPPKGSSTDSGAPDLPSRDPDGLPPDTTRTNP